MGEAQEGSGDTHRPLRVQQDVSELNDEGVGGLVVGFAQGVRQQLGAGGLDDHLGGIRGRDGAPRAWGRATSVGTRVLKRGQGPHTGIGARAGEWGRSALANGDKAPPKVRTAAPA